MAKLAICLAFVAALSLVHAELPLTYWRYLASENKFAGSFSRSMYKLHRDQNILVSPYSVFRALTLTYMAANGTTEHSLAQVLHFDWANGNKSAIYEAYMADAALHHRHHGAKVHAADHLYTNESTIVE